MDNDVVATVAHKVKDFVQDPKGLTVRLGDWNPNTRDRAEEIPHLEVGVKCAKLHPNADLGNTMANNVAVLKLNMEEDFERSQDITLKSVVDIRSGPKRPANNPEGFLVLDILFDKKYNILQTITN